MPSTTRILDANVNGTVYTSNANSALEAIDTSHSGTTAPTDQVANGKLWFDTSTTPGVLKVYKNGSWAVVHSGAALGATSAAITAAGSSDSFTNVTNSTAYNSQTVSNLGGGLRLGVDNLTGSAFSGDAYGSVLSTINATSLALGTNNVQRFNISSAGNISYVAPGNSTSFTNSTSSTAYNASTLSNAGGSILIGVDNSAGTALSAGVYGTRIQTTNATSLSLGTNNTERMRFDTVGNVGIGTVPASGYRLDVNGAFTVGGNYNEATATNGGGVNVGFDTGNGGNITSLNPGAAWYPLAIGSQRLELKTNGVERMRVEGDGLVIIGKTETAFGTNGVYMAGTGSTGITAATTPVGINRTGSDGEIMSIWQDTVQEGSISVSGTTVSYNGGHLSRWSRLPDGVDDSNIFKGTVMTNLNEKIVWETEAIPATYWEEGDELPEGVLVGDIKAEATPAGTEGNEQLNYTNVSSTEGDKNSAGVFVAWDESDQWGDYYLAMTGDMIIRIGAGITVERGDLLMSAGNGTAKPQEDDIVRSKTIAKVISTEVSCVYDDGSYCVPCVLMAC
jgi:hypothetical protein